MQLKFVLHTVPLSLHCEYLWAWQFPPMHVCMLLKRVWIWNMVMGVMLFHAGFDNAAPAAFHPPPTFCYLIMSKAVCLCIIWRPALSHSYLCVYERRGKGGMGGITNQPWEGNKREKRRKKKHSEGCWNIHNQLSFRGRTQAVQHAAPNFKVSHKAPPFIWYANWFFFFNWSECVVP